MARKKKADVAVDDEFLSSMATSLGGELAKDCRPSKYYIDTGNLALNFINSGRFLDGGLPGGRITEIYGPSASAKSLIGMNCLFGAQKIGGIAVYIDAENAMNGEFAARSSHIDLSKLVRYTPPHLKAAFNKIYNVIRLCQEKRPGVPLVFVYDSVSASPSERELKETKLSDSFTKEEFKRVVGAKEQPGERSRIISGEMRKLTPMLEASDATLVAINQIRNKIGVLYGNPETTGGNWVDYYPSCRLRVQKTATIVNKALETKVGTKTLETVIGTNIGVKNVKSRAYRPFMRTEGIKLFFDHGIDPLSGLLSVLIQTERVVPDGKGTYRVREDYAGNKDQPYHFKANKERNDVDLQVLLDNPAVVDADSAEAITEYMAPFLKAMQVSASDVVSEKAEKDELSDEEQALEALGEAAEEAAG